MMMFSASFTVMLGHGWECIFRHFQLCHTVTSRTANTARVSYITYKTAYTHAQCQVSFASYTTPYFFMIEKLWPAGSEKHKLIIIGMALWAINTQGECKESIWVIACLKQLSRRVHHNDYEPCTSICNGNFADQHTMPEWKESDWMSIYFLVY